MKQAFRILKYPGTLNGVHYSSLPQGTEPLTVQLQYGQPVIWAKVPINADTAQQKFTFRSCMTGQPNDVVADERYLGTIQMHGGDLVVHFFYTVEKD